MTGNRYGRLVVLREGKRTVTKTKRTEKGREGQVRNVFRQYMICKCDCGKEVETQQVPLYNGRTLSCGCIQREKVTTHGMKGTPFYIKWNSMVSRCKYPTCQSYDHYGGRGIRVCRRWQIFENFRDDMYESYQKHLEKHGARDTQLDRINTNGHYKPSNCRWATASQNAKNRRERVRNADGTFL